MAAQHPIDTDGTGAGQRPSGLTLLAAGAAFLLPVVWSPSVAAPFWSPKAAVALVLGGAGLTCLPSLWRSELRRPTMAATAFLAVAALSTLLSPDPVQATFGLYNWGTGLVFVAALVGAWAVGASLPEDATPLVTRALIAGVLVSGAVGVVQVVVDLGIDNLDSFEGRARGLAGNPVHLAGLALGLAALAATRVVGHRPTEAAGGTSPAGSTTDSGAVLLLAAAAGLVQLTASRFGLAALAVIVLVVAVRVGLRRSAVVALAIVVGVGVGAAIAEVGDGTSGTDRVGETSTGGVRARTEMWWASRHAVAERPLLGEGPGRFRAATSADRSLAFARAESPDRTYVDAHNLVVEYLVTTGVAGLAALAAWLALGVRAGRGPLLAFALGLLLMHLVQPQTVGTTALAFLALGASAAVRSPAPRSTGARWSAAGAVTVCLLAGGVLVAGDAFLEQATLDFDRRDGRVADRLLRPWSAAPTIMARTWVFEGRSEQDEGKLARGRAWRREAIEREPDDPENWDALATDELNGGRLDDAAGHYRQMLRRNPYSVNALNGLGYVAIAQRDGDEALDWFLRSLGVQPDQPAIADLVERAG